MTLFFFALIFVVLILLGLILRNEDEPRNQNKDTCYICDECNDLRWYKKGWVCKKCWRFYGLGNRISYTVWSKWKISDIKVEEIDCGNKL